MFVSLKGAADDDSDATVADVIRCDFRVIRCVKCLFPMKYVSIETKSNNSFDDRQQKRTNNLYPVENMVDLFQFEIHLL